MGRAQHGSRRASLARLAARRPAPAILGGAQPGAHSTSPLDRTFEDPPFVVSGMTLIDLDPRFVAEPPEVEAAPYSSPNWWTAVAITAAGFDSATLHEVTPERTPGSYADPPHAWEGTFPGTETEVMLEAAAYRGKVVHFALIGSVVGAHRRRGVRRRGQQHTARPGDPHSLVLLLVALTLARRNLRVGPRAQCAAQAPWCSPFALMMAIWLLSPHVLAASLLNGCAPPQARRSRCFSGARHVGPFAPARLRAAAGRRCSSGWTRPPSVRPAVRSDCRPRRAHRRGVRRRARGRKPGVAPRAGPRRLARQGLDCRCRRCRGCAASCSAARLRQQRPAERIFVQRARAGVSARAHAPTRAS